MAEAASEVSRCWASFDAAAICRLFQFPSMISDLIPYQCDNSQQYGGLEEVRIKGNPEIE
jgi:hypothetical protein